MKYMTAKYLSIKSGFKNLSLSFTVLLSLAMPGLVNAAVSAHLDRNNINTGDTVTLHITTSGDDQGKQPDLSPLKSNFDVLGTSSSTQIQIINGQRSDKHEWQIELAPLSKGSITIPALNVGNNKTPSLSLTVSEQPATATSQAGQAIFMKSDVSPAQSDTYVQQQIIYTVRLYYRVPLVEGSIADPKIDNAVVEQLGQDKQYNTTMNNQSYQVLERRYAIFPEHSGSLTIPPVIFTGRMVSEQGQNSFFGQSNSLIEQMLKQNGFNDPFFNSTPFGSRGKRVRLSSNAATLNIKPRPSAYKGSNWLPTQKLVLQDNWANSRPVIHAGEPVTRTLTLEAKGLEASQLPDIKQASSDTLRVYPEQPKLTNRTDGDWIYGRSEQRFTYVSSQPGTLHFPAITMSWWDSIKQKQIKTTLPSYDVTVLPGSAQTSTPATVSNSGKALPAASAPQTGNIKTQESKDSANIFNKPNTHTNWIIGGALSILGLVILLFLYLRAQRQLNQVNIRTVEKIKTTPSQTTTPDKNTRLKMIRKSLHEACINAAPQRAEKALLDYAALIWPDQPPQSLGALANRIGTRSDIIRDLEISLYGAKHKQWNGQLLWKAISEGLLDEVNKTTSQKQDEGAPPLYPDWSRTNRAS